MKVLRSTFVAAVAIFAAACGDKVTVAGPTAVTLTSTTTTTTVPAVAGKVISVSIAPATATLTIGQTITMIAAVNADAGIATTVTWTSSDATKASVSTAGLVTALVATPGVAICATSTANTGVKGCGSVVVTAASATIPATATIAGVFAGNLSTILEPTNVAGRVNVQVNISTGTEVVSKAYLLLGTTVVDSQNFSAAQSASLRYAGENTDSAAKDVSQPTIILTANTAAYNATTGAVTFANATGQALSVQLFVVGTTAARSTAKYSSTLTLNNPDVVYGSWTLPSTKVQAADASGYQWTSLGGGVLKMNFVPVLFSGKTATSVTVKYPITTTIISKASCASRVVAGATSGVCYSAATFGDTAQAKTLTVTAAGAISVDFSLWDRSMDQANLVTPPTPTLSAVYSDGSTTSDAPITALPNTSLALRVDNLAPAAITPAAQLRGGSATLLRSAATWGQRPAARLTDADSSALIAATGDIGSDAGVSAGHTLNADLRGITWAVYISPGGTTTSNDSAVVGTTAITAASAMTEASYHCVRIASSDKLGNVSKYEDSHMSTGSVIVTTPKCRSGGAGSGYQVRGYRLDNTAPVTAFAGLAGGDWSSADTATATAITTGMLNYYYTVTDASSGTDSISVCYYNNVSNAMAVTSYISSDAATTTCSKRIAGTGSGTNKPFTTATSLVAGVQLTNLTSATTGVAQIVISSQHYDAAGNVGNRVTRVVVFDNAGPTVSAATLGGVIPGDAPTVASFVNDGLSVSNYALEIAQNTALGVATTHAGTVTTSEGTGNMVLRGAYVATTDAISTAPFTKFLNVSASITAPAITYLVSWTTAVSGTSILAADALATTTVGYRYMALDQTGNRSHGGTFAAPTISSAITIPGVSPIAGAAGSITSIGLDGAFTYSTDYAASASAVSGSKVLSSTVRLKVSYNAKHDATSAFWAGKNSATGWVYCAGRTSATAGSPLMNGTSAMSESATIKSVDAPAVDLYLPIRAGGAQPTFQYYGTATVLNSNTVTHATANKGCGDVVTTTYAIPVTPTDRAFPLQNWTSGSAIWVLRHTQAGGFATTFPMGINFSR
ncbi:MAG: Ig-like domain-containing protein [Gemmatimonadetes bacterium]|nr:Ig-like domain-containing protein [Gemmatimonadota bacterium]